MMIISRDPHELTFRKVQSEYCKRALEAEPGNYTKRKRNKYERKKNRSIR